MLVKMDFSVTAMVAMDGSGTVHTGAIELSGRASESVGIWMQTLEVYKTSEVCMLCGSLNICTNYRVSICVDKGFSSIGLIEAWKNSARNFLKSGKRISRNDATRSYVSFGDSMAAAFHIAAGLHLNIGIPSATWQYWEIC